MTKHKHRLRNSRLAWTLRFAAWFLVLVPPVLAGAVYLVGRGLWLGEHRMVWIGLASLGLAGVLGLLHFNLAMSVYCPLCLVQPLGSRGCNKNHNAKRFLGSYRAGVAHSIITRGRFRCPYCGEIIHVKPYVRHQ